MPCELERPHHTPEGYVTLSETYLKFKVRFPLHFFFVEVLKYFGLTMFQVTPNGWAYMIGRFGLFVERGMGPSLAAEFTWFYSVKGSKNDEGFYYFTKRPAKGLQAVTKIRETFVPRRSCTFSLQRLRSRAPSVVHVSSLLGLHLN